MSVFDPKICQEGHTDKMQCLEAERDTLKTNFAQLEIYCGTYRKEIVTLADHLLKMQTTNGSLTGEIDRLKAELELQKETCRTGFMDRDSWKSKYEEMLVDYPYAKERKILREKAEAMAVELRKIALATAAMEDWKLDQRIINQCVSLAKAALAEFEEKDGPKKTNNLTYEDTV